MLLAALLLIEGVSLTIGATVPLFPRKGTHLRIPVAADTSWDSSEINALITRSAGEEELKGPTNYRRVLKESSIAPSSPSPYVWNVVAQPRYRRQARDSSVPPDALHPTAVTVNTPSLLEVKYTDEVPSTTPTEGKEDLLTGSREPNDTNSGNIDDHHHLINEYVFTNDSAVNVLTPFSTVSAPDIQEKIIGNYELKQLSDDTQTNVSDSKPDKSENNRTDSNSYDVVQNDTLDVTVNKKLEPLVDVGDEGKSGGSQSKEGKMPQELHKHSTSTIKPPSIKSTRRPTRKPRLRNNRKPKTTTESTKPETLLNKTSTKVLNVSSKNPMLQDGAYQIATSPATFTDHSQTDVDKAKADSAKKNKTARISPFSTTPDSHMNDPPFRGPNVGLDIDRLYTEKQKTKMDFKSPEVEKSSFLSTMLKNNHGRLWMPEKKISGALWSSHFFIVGSLFAAIAVYSFVSLLRVNTFLTLLHTGYYILSNSIILLLCLLRSLFMFYDPYNLTGKYPTVLASLLPRLTLPCLNTVFLFSMLSLFKTTETRMRPSWIQRTSVFAFFAIFLFTSVICTEIVVWVLKAPNFLLMIELSIVLLFAKASALFYTLDFRKLQFRALRKQGEMIRLIFTKMHIDGAQLPKKLPKPTVGLAVNLLLFSSFLQILLAFAAPFDFYNFHFLLMPSMTLEEPWVWWGFQLTIRTVELLMTATLSFVVTQPVKHFEANDDKFCSIFMWFPCSSVAEWCRKEEQVDFEAHSDNYANLQGIRNSALNTENARRLQTNSLPTFRTPATEVDKNLPMRTLPCSGRHTNHASAVSLLSYYRSKRTLSSSTNDGLEELERTLCNQATMSSDGRNNSLRPASMLYKDNGFIRFRRETDPEQPMEMSDEDACGHEDIDTSLDGESTKANVGSSFRSLLEGDVVNTLSPFFQVGYKRRFRKMSRVSIETTDYSADVSSDQLSNVVNLRNGLSTSALDFHTRKYGSTCSSESAANSFDVTFFLNSNSSPEMQTSPTSTTPASLNVCSAYRSETEDDKTSSVEGHEVMLRSVSPIVKRASSGRLSLNLNLHAAAGTNHSSGHVNVACGTEDITPDSAVYLDMQLSRESTMNPSTRGIFPSSFASPTRSPSISFNKSSDGIMPISPETDSNRQSTSVSPTSQSLDELRTSNSYAVAPRIRKGSRGLLYKLRGSTFSLNAAIYGYEPLEQVDSSRSSHGQSNRKRLQRSSSDRLTSSDHRLLSDGQLGEDSQMTPLGEFSNRTNEDGSFLGDSGLLGDCGVVLVDVASQTDESVLVECPHKNCTLLMKTKMLSGSQSQLSMQMVDVRK